MLDQDFKKDFLDEIISTSNLALPNEEKRDRVWKMITLLYGNLTDFIFKDIDEH